MSQRVAVFDCDGTLVDGQHEVCSAMEAAFAAHDLAAPARHDIRRIVGLSLPNAIRRLAPSVSQDTVGGIVQAYKQAFFDARQSGQIHEPLFEGVEDLLRQLSDEGWQLAVATGKSDRGLNACLETHGIADLFVSLQTADRHPSKPQPEMLEAAIVEAGGEAHSSVMIGDTTFDMHMARSAKVRAVGVIWGYHSADELLASGAEIVARDPAHLAEILS